MVQGQILPRIYIALLWMTLMFSLTLNTKKNIHDPAVEIVFEGLAFKNPIVITLNNL
jgi:hypothetical protein